MFLVWLILCMKSMKCHLESCQRARRLWCKTMEGKRGAFCGACGGAAGVMVTECSNCWTEHSSVICMFRQCSVYTIHMPECIAITRKNDKTMNVMADCCGYGYVICINPYHKSYYGDVHINASVYLDPFHYIILSYYLSAFTVYIKERIYILGNIIMIYLFIFCDVLITLAYIFYRILLSLYYFNMILFWSKLYHKHLKKSSQFYDQCIIVMWFTLFNNTYHTLVMYASM